MRSLMSAIGVLSCSWPLAVWNHQARWFISYLSRNTLPSFLNFTIRRTSISIIIIAIIALLINIQFLIATVRVDIARGQRAWEEGRKIRLPTVLHKKNDEMITTVQSGDGNGWWIWGSSRNSTCMRRQVTSLHIITKGKPIGNGTNKILNIFVVA